MKLYVLLLSSYELFASQVIQIAKPDLVHSDLAVLVGLSFSSFDDVW